MFDCKAKTLQQGVHDAPRNTIGCVHKSFFDASEVVNRSLRLVVGTQNVMSRLGRGLRLHSWRIMSNEKSQTRIAYGS